MRRAALLLALAFVQAPAAGALFDDEEARRQVAELRKQVEAMQREVADRRAIVELAGMIDALKADIAGLRGQIEVVANRIDQLDRRQKDLYVDLDNRLRKFESAQAEKDKVAQATGQPTAQETQAYETALAHFKSNNYGTAIQQLQAFVQQYPQGALAPSAQYWIGNAYYALRDYKLAITAQQKVVAGWPDNAKAPDAMLNIASSQAESGDAAGARKTLGDLVAKYPKSPAADQARQRLAKK